MSINKEFIQGKWYKINIKNKKKIKAQYNRIKDWKIDPKGYFLINVDKNNDLLKKHF